VVKVHYDFGYASSWVVDHFAELCLSVGLIPVSALVVLLGGATRGWRTTEAERAFLAVAAPAFVLLVIEVGIYASRFSLRIEERNMFVVAPLLFLAFALWLERGLPRPMILTVVAAVAPAAALLTLNLKNLLNISVLSDTFGLVPLLRLSEVVDGGLDTVRILVLAGGCAAAVAFLLLPRRVAAVALPLALGVFLVVSSYSVFRSIQDQSRATLALTSPTNPSWIDNRIGYHSEAAFVYGTSADFIGDAQIMWQTEFWNRSVGTIVYPTGFPDPASLPTRAANFDALTGRVTAGGSELAGIHYAVAPSTVQLAGERLDQQGRLVLYRIDPPMRFASLLGGVFADGWMGEFAALTHYAKPSRPGRLRVRLSREAWRGESPPGHVTIKLGTLATTAGGPAVGEPAVSRTWTIQSGAARQFVLPTPTVPYRLEIHVDPTFAPSSFGGIDERQLGAQIELRDVP
jgi:hypothetical protein